MSYSPYLIPLEDAVAQTHSFQSTHPNMVKAFRIDVKELNDMLNVPGTQYVRAYMGLDGEGNQTMVLVCADAEGNDMTNIEIGGEIISGTFDMTLPCPTTCSTRSPLMLTE